MRKIPRAKRCIAASGSQATTEEHPKEQMTAFKTLPMALSCHRSQPPGCTCAPHVRKDACNGKWKRRAEPSVVKRG